MRFLQHIEEKWAYASVQYIVCSPYLEPLFLFKVYETPGYSTPEYTWLLEDEKTQIQQMDSLSSHFPADGAAISTQGLQLQFRWKTKGAGFHVITSFPCMESFPSFLLCFKLVLLTISWHTVTMLRFALQSLWIDICLWCSTHKTNGFSVQGTQEQPAVGG